VILIYADYFLEILIVSIRALTFALNVKIPGRALCNFPYRRWELNRTKDA